MTGNTLVKGGEPKEIGRLSSATLHKPDHANRWTLATELQRKQLSVGIDVKRADELQKAVHAAFFSSGYAALYFIDCQVNNRQLVLSGKVPSYYLKQLAQVLALRVEGIEQIDNCLEVSRRF